MSSVPVTCPHCYQNIHAPAPTSDGLVRCNACGHAFPIGGGNVAGRYTPPVFNPTPVLQPLSSAPVSNPGGKNKPVYPPASGPQKPGNPGLVACGVIVGLGFLGLLCCGGVASLLYFAVDQQIVANQNVDPPPVNTQPFNPQPFNPPIGNPPNFNPVPPQPFPEIPQPVFPDVPSLDPFEPVAPPPSAIPTRPAPPPSPKSLDDFITAMQTIDARNFTVRQLLDELNTLPVEETRRDEVVEALLELLKRAGVHAGGLLAGPGETALEKWASEAQATKVAEFAAGEGHHFARRPLLKVLAKIGGDAETAKALLPLVKDPGSLFSLPDVFAKIGPEAEEPLLSELENADTAARRTLFASLGKVGGAKSKAKLQALIRSGEGFDRVFGGQALNEIQSRESKNQ